METCTELDPELPVILHNVCKSPCWSDANAENVTQ